MAQITFTTCQEWPKLIASDNLVAEHLKHLGHDILVAPWDEDLSTFTSSDLVILRANWDYHQKIPDFERWLLHIDSSPARMLNPLEMVQWNLRKSYMMELGKNGLSIPKTFSFKDGAELRTIYSRQNWDTAILKPAYGASGMLVKRVAIDELEEWINDVYPKRPADEWLVQEYLENITKMGELSLVFINGTFTHGVRKIPHSGDFRIHSRFKGVTEATEISADVLDQAQHVMNFVVQRFGESPLYTRIDGVVQPDGRFLLLELELNEPTLYFDFAPKAAKIMARAIHERLKR